MQMQPRPAAARARSRSCCWLPPQPCTNRIPGTVVAGASSVPARYSLSTGICSCSRSASIVFDNAVLRQGADLLVLALELDLGVLRHLAFAIDLERGGTNDFEIRFGSESLQRSHFRGACSADPPGLLQNTGAPVAVAGSAARHIVVAAGCVQARKGLE